MIAETRKPSIPEVLPLVKSWYAKLGNAAGGIFHVILSDANCEQMWADQALAGGRHGPTAIHAIISGNGGVLALPVNGSAFIVTRTLVRSYTAQNADAATDAANHDGTVVQ